jgi:hypothetical protein
MYRLFLGNNEQIRKEVDQPSIENGTATLWSNNGCCRFEGKRGAFEADGLVYRGA